MDIHAKPPICYVKSPTGWYIQNKYLKYTFVPGVKENIDSPA